MTCIYGTFRSGTLHRACVWHVGVGVEDQLWQDWLQWGSGVSQGSVTLWTCAAQHRTHCTEVDDAAFTLTGNVHWHIIFSSDILVTRVRHWMSNATELLKHSETSGYCGVIAWWRRCQWRVTKTCRRQHVVCTNLGGADGLVVLLNTGESLSLQCSAVSDLLTCSQIRHLDKLTRWTGVAVTEGRWSWWVKGSQSSFFCQLVLQTSSREVFVASWLNLVPIFFGPKYKMVWSHFEFGFNYANYGVTVKLYQLAGCCLSFTYLCV